MKSLLLAIVTLAFVGSVSANEPTTAPATDTATTTAAPEKKETKTADAHAAKKTAKKKH